MQRPSGKAFLHVLLLYGVCVVMVATGLFDGVCTELGYEYYAEQPVSWLPRFIAMPCNSIVNLGYIAVGAYWLWRRPVSPGEAYHKDVFAWMALGYGPVQWARLATQAQRPAALDQWVTLPIFAWVPVWAAHLLGGPATLALATQTASVASYGLALAHCQGFELALACHILLAVLAGLAVQSRLGGRDSLRHMGLAVASCAGFVGLKLLDQPLARWGLLPGYLSGHFVSKICDILQFHFSLCFLECLGRQKERRRAE
ncbi:transmembrane protein 187-like [Scyliorhinus torazame]|uniref:transmembrane protein 187-like n=1 Tax=Scyliorhinus torazame TaxID=75743 RepID=UPI003B59BCBE